MDNESSKWKQVLMRSFVLASLFLLSATFYMKGIFLSKHTLTEKSSY